MAYLVCSAMHNCTYHMQIMLLLRSKSSTNYGTILTILLNEATMLLLKVSDFVNCLDILKSSLVIIMLPICMKECLVFPRYVLSAK